MHILGLQVRTAVSQLWSAAAPGIITVLCCPSRARARAQRQRPSALDRQNPVYDTLIFRPDAASAKLARPSTGVTRRKTVLECGMGCTQADDMLTYARSALSLSTRVPSYHYYY